MTDRTCQVTDCPRPVHGRGLCHSHLEIWRYRQKKNPDADPDSLRPDAEQETRRERWVKAWLMNGKGGPLVPEVCPWRCTYHLRVGMPQIDSFLDPSEIEADWDHYRDEVLAMAEASGKVPWAARVLEGAAA